MREEKMKEIEEIAKQILGAMQPSFADYHPPEGEFLVRKKEEAALAFVNTVWSTPAAMVLYAAPSLGLNYPIGGPTLRVYRKKGKGSVYRVCLDLEYEKDILLIFTAYWDIEVERRGKGKKRTYYCRLIDYGVEVFKWGADQIRPIIKL